jgi:hypothetical protein
MKSFWLLPLVSNPKSLRARIIVAQSDPRLWLKQRPADFDAWLATIQNSWDAFFPPENTSGSQLAELNVADNILSPSDSMLRILTVFAPFDHAS